MFYTPSAENSQFLFFVVANLITICLKRIIFTVTNDLSFDQRMKRICHSLSENGYAVTLIGRQRASSPPLAKENYRQVRLRCRFNSGKLFYAEYNLRLFFCLLFTKGDCIGAVDLDTIIPCLLVSKLKRIKRVYDAHELFSEMKEVITRKRIKKVWTRIEKFSVPQFRHGYTVSEGIAEEFRRRYGVGYKTIRNVPLLEKHLPLPEKKEQFILYRGAVNEARGFEYLIPALQWIDCRLVICGDGNFMEKLKALIREYALEQKVELKGMLPPAELNAITRQATIGIALAEREGLNQYLALPNKFFDYIHAGLPQVTMNFPEYEKINRQYEVAVLIEDLSPKRIADAVNNLLHDAVLYQRLQQNCIKAREIFNWQNEEKKLLAFYQSIFAS
jgi:glycosyltransferase involved in cell wall biosynthesis